MNENDIVDKTLRSRTLHGLWWSLIDWGGLRGIQFVIGIILARLLLPEQFGLIGMLAIFMAVAQSFLDSGFGSALIQKQETTQVEYCSIFYFNIVVGLASAAIICLAAPWIAAFYDEPLLTPLARVLSLNIVINAFGLIQTTLMTKRVDFKTLAGISISTAIFSGVIGVAMAFQGFGVWSLVVQSLGATVFRTLFLWVFNSWRPSLLFSFIALRKMFAFGSRLLASGLLNTVFDNIYLLVIGKLYSASELGFYTRAQTVQQLPSQGLCNMVGRVTFPIFATVQNDVARFKTGFRGALGMLVWVNFPLMIGLALVARPLVLILLTERWAPCIPYLQLLCIVGLMYPVHALNLNVLVAKGRSDLFFRLEVLKKILIVIGIAIAFRWGVEGLIWSQIVLSFATYFLNSYYTGVLLDYPAREQLVDILPYLGASLVMGACVHLVQWIPFASNWALLLSEVATGVVVYAVLCGCLRLHAFLEAVSIFRSYMRPARAA